MKLRQLLLLVTFPFALPTQAEECSSKLITWAEYDQTIISIQRAYHQEDFKTVDSALACLLKSNSTFLSGQPGAVAAYWFFRGEMPAPGGDAQDTARIRAWKEKVPDSVFPRFAELRQMYSQAWNARGTKYANETSEDQFKKFHSQLLKTESAILSDTNKLKDTPISYNLLMAVTMDTRGAQTSPIDTFNEGVRRWPNYYDFYEVLLTRLVPKWGGSWEEVDRFIDHWSTTLKSTEEDSTYARLYYNVHTHNRISPQKTLVKWKRLKRSLNSLNSKYPTKKHLEISASYACYYSDKEYYMSLMEENMIKTTKFWLRGSSKEKCDKYFKK